MIVNFKMSLQNNFSPVDKGLMNS